LFLRLTANRCFSTLASQWCDCSVHNFAHWGNDYDIPLYTKPCCTKFSQLGFVLTYNTQDSVGSSFTFKVLYYTIIYCPQCVSNTSSLNEADWNTCCVDVAAAAKETDVYSGCVNVT
jgi:hypothetical protein